MSPVSWRRWAVRGGVVALLSLTALFLVGRGVVEVLILDPTRPESYRDDWGGPHYLGVLLVHAGPGLLALALAGLALHRVVRRRSRARDAAPSSRPDRTAPARRRA